MLFTKSMNSKEMDQKFQEGVRLWEDGQEQEAAELWADLALLGHLDSITKLARIFIDQREFEKSETYLKYATDQSSPHVQNLRLEIARERETENLRIELAANPDTSLEILETLAKDGSIFVRHNVGGNPSASLKILELLSKDDRALVRGVVAVNPNSSLEILVHLSQDVSFFIQDEVAEVMMALAESPTTSPQILEQLAQIEDLRDGKSGSNIRRRVAENPSTPPDTLNALSKDKDFQVLWGVAVNPSSSQTILELLALEEDHYVREYVAKNPKLNQSILEKLSRDSEEGVRISVAGNPSTSQTTLGTLSKDEEEEVREAVAKNPNAGLATLELLSEDGSERVRRNVALNPNSSAQILDLLAQDEDSDVSQNAKRELISEPIDHSRPETSENAGISTGIEKLKLLLTETDAKAREEFLEDTNLILWIASAPIDLLAALISDENAYLKSRAQGTLKEKLFRHQLSGSGIFLNKEMLKAKKEFQYFSDAERYFKDGKNDDAVELLFELAVGGHIESFEKIYEIFLNQGDFEYVEELLNDFITQDNPKILYLRAKLIEKWKSTDLDLYIKAASAGSLSAMLTLVEKLALIDREEAKKWLDEAKRIGISGTQHYEEMLQIKPLPMSLKIIVVTSDETGQWIEYVVQRFESSELVFEFESLETAIDYCISQESGFAVIQVNEDWVRLNSESQYRIKVLAHRSRVTIAEGIYEYWFGDLNDIDAAVEEVSGRDCDWEMVYYVSIDHEVGEDDDDDDYSFDSSNTYQPPQPQIAESTKRSGFDFF
jgi:3-methyladenine DNA glycosylase AlkC